MAEEKTITLHPRRLARQIARAELDRAGVTGYNKTREITIKGIVINGPSKFSRYWRRAAATAAGREAARKKKH